jgi:hypothetical protein
MYAIHRRRICIRIPESFDPFALHAGKCRSASPLRLPAVRRRPSQCIGAGQALVELKLIVARIAQRFELDPRARSQGRAGSRLPTMFPRYGMKMRITPREGVASDTTGESRSEQARQFYNAAAALRQDFAFMNYALRRSARSSLRRIEPEKNCLQLYRHLIGSTNRCWQARRRSALVGAAVSAAHVAATYQPASYLGIDISEKQSAPARRTLSRSRAIFAFQQGNAKRCRCPIELRCAAQCRGLASVRQPRAVLLEAFRVLAPGGVSSMSISRGRTRIPPA